MPAEDLADLFDNAPCGYLSLLPDGRIAKVNRTLSGWLRRPTEDLLGLKVGDVLSFGGRIAFETHLTPMLRLTGEVGEVALDLIDQAGIKIPVIASARERRDGEGKHRFTRITMFKAKARHLYERSIVADRDQAQAELLAGQETAHLREQFIAVLGHDLRNPLAALASGTRILGRDPLSERSRYVIQQMELSIARATLLIDNVLDFARGRLGEGLILTRNAKEPLTPVLEHVVSEVRAIVPDRTIVSHFAISEPMDCDRERIGQLAANLLSNAVAHGSPDQPIEIESYSTEDTFVFRVTNGGQPISPQAREHLFQPFFRGEARPSQHGLGLGLFIVSEIAKAHGGAMDVQSDASQTTFIFRMPLNT